MKMNRWAAVALLVSGIAYGQDASTPIVPVSTNKDDAPPRVKTGKVFASTNADTPPALGPASAKVVVLIFSDFQCPVCRRTADATQQIAEEFPGDVRIEFWQHALVSHANAENAAVASLAAQRQGKFWEYHDELFRNQSVLDPDSLARYAGQVGLDATQFQKDYADPALRERAKREASAAESFGAKNTPAFLINGKLKMGWGSWLAFRSDVERELAEANKITVTGTSGPSVAEQRAQAQITDPALFQLYRDQVLRASVDPPKVEEPKAEETKKSKKRKHQKDS
jgi:protein-disulfide isomerase